MSNYKTFYITSLILMLIYSIHAKAQSPQYDLNWSLQSSLSDDFDGTALNTNKWCVLNNTGTPPCAGYNWGGNTNFQPDHVSLGADGSKNVLMLKVDPPTINTSSPFDPIYDADTITYTFSQCCHTGGIQMVEGNTWTYGYIEISAKLPGFSNNNVGYANKFWPTFWSYNQYSCGGGSNIGQDEIDIMDECCSTYSDARSTGAGWHHKDPNNCNPTNSPWETHINSTLLCDDYHKIGAEWNTDRVIFYIDDTPWFSTTVQNLTMTPQRVLIDLQIDMNTNKDFSPGTIFPQYMKVDYFHYYKLRLDCSSSLTILNNTQLANYWISGVPAVKSNITFGNGTGAISLSTGGHYIFRAVNTITINGDYTVPLGAELTLMPTPCN